MKEVFEVQEAKEMLLNSPLNDTAFIRGVRSVAFNCSQIETEKNPSRPPHYGEHTIEILNKILGYKPEMIQLLLEKGTIHAKKD
jgi:hypothetical protein